MSKGEELGLIESTKKLLINRKRKPINGEAWSKLIPNTDVEHYLYMRRMKKEAEGIE